MNISKFLRKNMAVILLILLISSTMAYMNYQSMLENKEGFFATGEPDLITKIGIVFFIIGAILSIIVFFFNPSSSY